MSPRADLSLTVLYTVSVRGELRLLPYLFTLVKQQKYAAPGITVLVDLGETCRADWPICRLTEGRALMVAMDGMGYDAFNLTPDDPLTANIATQNKLRDTVVTAVLTPGQATAITKKIGEEQYVQIRVSGGDETAPPDPDTRVAVPTVATIYLSKGEALASRITDDAALVVEDRRESRIPELGRITLRLDGQTGRLVLLDQRRLPIPAGIMPDPSVSSVVEFVESETQYAAKQRE